MCSVFFIASLTIVIVGGIQLASITFIFAGEESNLHKFRTACNLHVFRLNVYIAPVYSDV